MADRWRRAARLALLIVGLTPAPAAADWYFTPYFGWDLHATTTITDLEYKGEPRRKVTFGGSAMLLHGILGLEADWAYVPQFFQNPRCEEQTVDPAECVSLGRTVVNSHVQTLTGNIVIAAPLALTQESLRPYIAAGIGWMDAYSEDLFERFVADPNLLAFNVGGGAIGMLGTRTGLRFDLRRFTNLDRGTPSGTSFGSARVNFWRATVGVTVRY